MVCVRLAPVPTCGKNEQPWLSALKRVFTQILYSLLN